MRRIAINIIEKAFKDKLDKSGLSYLVHLFAVEENVHKYAGSLLNEKYYIVALLHDLIEDCDEWELHHIDAIFNDAEITEALRCITKDENLSYAENILRLINNPIARAVKLADIEHNINPLRLNTITQDDIVRIMKYHTAYQQLKSVNDKFLNGK